MQDGALTGARFDGAIDAGNHTRMTVNLANPALSANDADTPGNQLRTHLIVTGTDATGKGMFSFGDLLGSGMASDQGARFIDDAVKAIEKVQADVSALLALDTKPTTLDTILEGQWTELEKALDKIFGTESGAETGATSAVRTTAPREEDILDEIADILDALSSEAAFVAATAEGGGGAFDDPEGRLGAGAAADAFNRLTWSAEATLGRTGSTRYGTAVRKTSGNAKAKPAIADSDYGAFSYATMQETLRTADAAAVSLTGIASYSGGTRAVSPSGKAYAGTMDLQVRFKANSVSGVVSGLEDSEGLPWQHNFADVDRIVLDDGTLQRNAKWDKDDGANATIFYAPNSGLLRPVNGVTNTFAGILLGRGADAGSEASGTWSVGTAGNAGYLAGGFGVEHVGDTARPAPPVGDASTAGATLFSMAADANAAANMTKATIGSGMLTVKQRSYGWTRADITTAPAYGALGAAGEEVLITAKFDLEAMAEAGAGTPTTVNGPKWVDQVIATLTKERDLLATLQGLDSADTQTAERAAWQRAQDAVRDQMLGNLPLKLAAPYDDPTDSVTNELESEADAIDLINRAIDALSSNANLAAALDPDGTGIFDHHDGDGNGEPDDFVNAAKTKVGTRTFAQMRGEKTHQVFASLGTTSYTRFGVWRRQSTQDSIRTGGVLQSHGGPGTFAYSPLDPTNAGTPANPGFPKGGSASYTGETVAIQNTTLLTGTVRVDVTWNNALDADNNGTIDDPAGSMALTISGLASLVGDPLSHGGSDTEGSEAPGNEIGDIVLGGFAINVGQAGDNANDLIVGTADTSDATAVTYTEIASTTARLRFSSLGTPDNTSVPSNALVGTATTDGSSVKALFVGQGVDGPLGVIGTWSLRDSGIGRVSDDGTTVKDLGAPIYGAFGAQVP